MASAGKVGALLVEMRADLGKLRLDVKEMEGVFKSSFTNLQSEATKFGRNLLSAFGIGLSVNALVQFGRGVVDLAGKLSDLSEQTGISAQTLSGIKSTLEENGTSVDALATGLVRLQKELLTIKNDADPAAQAFTALGLNYKDLAKLGTEDLLKKITDALGKQDDVGRRNAIAMTLMSKAGRELVPGLTAIAGRLDELRAKGMNPKDIKLLDDFGDALTNLGNVAKIVASGPLALLVEQFNAIVGATEQGRITKGLIEVEDQIEKLQRTLERRQTSRAKGTAIGSLWESLFPTPTDDTGIKKQLEQAFALRTELDKAQQKLNEPKAKAKPSGESILTDPAAANAIKRAREQVEGFIDGLQKQNLALELSQMEVGKTTEEIKKLELQQEKNLFINKILREEFVKTIPPELLAKIDQWNAKILENTTAIAKEKRLLEEIQAVSKAWVKDIDDLTKAEEEWAAIKFDPISLGMDDLSKMLDEISKKYMTMIVQMQASARAARATPEEIETVTRRLLINRAVEQSRARADFTGEGVDPEEEAKKRAEQFGEDLANSLTGGMRNTLLGIETGQQTLGEGMKNLVRNMLLELEGAIFDKTILEPLKTIAAGFISGLVGALDDAANTQLKDWAKGLGQQVSSWLGTGLSSILGAFGGGGGGVNASTATFSSWEGGFIGRERGGMLPSFAGGGLFIGHGGEFVMQKKAVDSIGADTLGAMNKSGRMPGGGATAVTVEINGDITPRQPNMTPDQVVRVTAGNITNDGMIMSAIEQRMRMKGR